jgi:hypothetical protein
MAGRLADAGDRMSLLIGLAPPSPGSPVPDRIGAR